MTSRKKEPVRLKVDFNLLMSGTWVLEKKGKQRIHKFEKKLETGKVTIYNALDIPSTLDSKILDYLMLKSQENDWSEKIEIESLRKLCQEVGFGIGKKKIERIKKALEILVNTRIRFENCFIDNGTLEYIEGGDYEVINIGILNDYSIEKTRKKGKPRKVSVWFNKNFLALCKHSLGYKLIPYAPIQGLRDTAYALYKWAWRWFSTEKGYGERWIGDGKKLVEWYRNELNSVANYKYPSEVLRRVRSAIKQLNENPKVPFYLQLKEEDGNYKIEIHLKELCTLKREIPFDKLPSFLKGAVISLIERKKHIREPFAFARSMSYPELERMLKKVALIPLDPDNWNLIQTIVSKNELEKKEIAETVLATGKKDNEVLLAVEKSKLTKSNPLCKILDVLTPNWRTFAHDAVGYLKEKQLKEAEV